MEAGYRTDDRSARDARGRSDLVSELHGETATAVLRDAARPADGSLDAAEQADGALEVSESLDTLRHHGWTVLHDLHWPGRPGQTVDHVAVGRGGVVVVHVRSWSGTVTVADGWLRQNGFRRDRELDKAYAATAAVRALLRPEHRTATIGLICLAGRDQRLAPTSAGVPVVGRDGLVDVLRSAPPQLSADDVWDIGALLARRLTRDLIPGQATAPFLRTSREPETWSSSRAPWRR